MSRHQLNFRNARRADYQSTHRNELHLCFWDDLEANRQRHEEWSAQFEGLEPQDE